eukprot:811273-Karenia_brevis.AAC.1
MELKTLHFGSSTYPAGADERCQAVNRRARALPAEMRTKAQHLDVRYCGSVAGEIGPVERRLLSYGPVRGLVAGHWAEASDHMEMLLAGCAYS